MFQSASFPPGSKVACALLTHSFHFPPLYLHFSSFFFQLSANSIRTFVIAQNIAGVVFVSPKNRADKFCARDSFRRTAPVNNGVRRFSPCRIYRVPGAAYSRRFFQAAGRSRPDPRPNSTRRPSDTFKPNRWQIIEAPFSLRQREKYVRRIYRHVPFFSFFPSLFHSPFIS